MSPEPDAKYEGYNTLNWDAKIHRVTQLEQRIAALEAQLAEAQEALREIADGHWTQSADLCGATYAELRAIQIARETLALRRALEGRK